MPAIFPAATKKEDNTSEPVVPSGLDGGEGHSGVSSRSSPPLPLNATGKFAVSTAGPSPPIPYHPLPHIVNHQMLEMQPDHFISRERTSNTRGPTQQDEHDSLPIDPLLSTFQNPTIHRYHPEDTTMNDGTIPIRNINTVEAMEVNAARALEELALNRGLRGDDTSGNDRSQPPPRSRSVRSHSATSPRPSDATPFSSNGSVVADDDADGSEEGQDAVARLEDHSPSFSPAAHSPLSPASGSSRPQRNNVARKQRSGAPVPVPFLTKPSRGRRVPIASASDASAISALTAAAAEGDMSDDDSRPSLGTRGGKKGADSSARLTGSTRAYVCAVDGCGKAFRRGEHLKRHVRSLHTHEKPERCTFPGCGKEFSRKDNMMQHLKIHGHTHSRKEIPSTNIPIMTVEPTIHPAAHS